MAFLVPLPIPEAVASGSAMSLHPGESDSASASDSDALLRFEVSHGGTPEPVDVDNPCTGLL